LCRGFTTPRLSRAALERLWLADVSSVTLLPMVAPPTLTVSVELPLSAGEGASPDPTVVGDELRLLWIIEQVRLQRIGVGKGAELAGLPRAAFMQALGVHGVPVIDYAPSDLQRELDAQDAV
jgi:predicted HTH domain antitoxin